jgi:hypothetical protein
MAGLRAESRWRDQENIDILREPLDDSIRLDRLVPPLKTAIAPLAAAVKTTVRSNSVTQKSFSTNSTGIRVASLAADTRA